MKTSDVREARLAHNVPELLSTSSGTSMTGINIPSTSASPGVQAQSPLDLAPGARQARPTQAGVKDPSDLLSISDSVRNSAAAKLWKPSAPQVARSHTSTSPEQVRASMDSFFAGQKKRSIAFFANSPPQPPAQPVSIKRTLDQAFDPYQQDSLHCPELDLSPKRRKLTKQGSSRNGKSSQDPGAHFPGDTTVEKAAPIAQASKAPTARAGHGQPRDPMEMLGLERGGSVVPAQAGRRRAHSAGRLGTQKTIEAPTVSTAVSNAAVVPRPEISADDDKHCDTPRPSRPWDRVPSALSSTNHRSKSRTFRSAEHPTSGSSKRGLQARPFPPARPVRRTPAAPSPDNVIDLSKSSDDGLHGYIGAGASRRPHARPGYTFAERVTLEQQLKAERQKKKLAKERKDTAQKSADGLVVQQAQQRPSNAAPINEKRLLNAQGPSGWVEKEAVAPGPRDDSTPAQAFQKRPMLDPKDTNLAVAEMRLLQSKISKPPPARVVHSVPPGFGEQSHPDILGAQRRQCQEQARIDKQNQASIDKHLRRDFEVQEYTRLLSRYRKDTPRRVRRDHPEQTEEWVEQEVKKRIDNWVKKKEAAQTKSQEEFNGNLLSVAVEELENGLGEQESHHAHGDDPRVPHPRVRGVPASEALHRREMYVYVVQLSEPCKEADVHVVYNATKEFGRKDEANSYLRDLILDKTPPKASRRSKKEQEYESITIAFGSGPQSGLLWGMKKLRGGEATGKWIMAYVEQKRQMTGDLAPDCLRNKYVDQELLDKYVRVRYQVTLIRIAPVAFKEATEVEEKASKHDEEQLKRQHEMSGNAVLGESGPSLTRTEEAAKQATAEGTEEDEAATPPGLTGDDVREKLANGGWCGGGPTDDHDADDEASISQGSSMQASEDEDQPGDEQSECCSMGAHRDSCGRHSHDADDMPDVACIPLGSSFTTRDLANRYALNVAKEAWKPREPHMDAYNHWHTKVLPYLETQGQRSDLGHVDLTLTFPKFDFRGVKAGHRLWGFARSQVLVTEMALEGPIDLDIAFVRNADDVFRPESVQEAVAIAVEEAEQTTKLAALRNRLHLKAQQSAKVAAAEEEEAEEVGESDDGDDSSHSEEE